LRRFREARRKAFIGERASSHARDDQPHEEHRLGMVDGPRGLSADRFHRRVAPSRVAATMMKLGVVISTATLATL
jgi:hypothetical protein